MKKVNTSDLPSSITCGLHMTNKVGIAETTVEDELDREVIAIVAATKELQEEYRELTGESVEIDEDLIAQEEAIQQQHQEEIKQTFVALEALSAEIVKLDEEIDSAKEKGDETVVAQKEAQLKQKEEQERQIVATSMGVSGVQLNLNSIDLATALSEIQSQRAALLEDQLQDQIEKVQNWNDRLSDLNEQLRQAQENGDIVLATELKGLIDEEMSNYQFEMLRLQSLSTKRNEAFETLTNVVRKMQDSRSSIIGNMR
ncbi:hypothetical protein [Bacillus sp. JCM 19034]|uniref:hypothetical protein n=1 Tax=Bacillus sp. JCM 19034 TaxID=1481928 RepID=UPI0007857C98|nr:hypothetical protein [Bacillus sp. JCM 19034]